MRYRERRFALDEAERDEGRVDCEQLKDLMTALENGEEGALDKWRRLTEDVAHRAMARGRRAMDRQRTDDRRHTEDLYDIEHLRRGRDQDLPPPGGAAGGSYPQTPGEMQRDWERRAADRRNRQWDAAIRASRRERAEDRLQEAQDNYHRVLGAQDEAPPAVPHIDTRFPESARVGFNNLF